MAVVIALWRMIEFLIKIISKKNNTPESAKAIEAETKEIVLNLWTDTKNRLDGLKDQLVHITETIDFLNHVASELDEKKIRVVWRDTEREKKDHKTLAHILEIQEELSKAMAILADRIKR